MFENRNKIVVFSDLSRELRFRDSGNKMYFKTNYENDMMGYYSKRIMRINICRVLFKLNPLKLFYGKSQSI